MRVEIGRQREARREMIFERTEALIVVIASALVAAGLILWRARFSYLKAQGRRKHARM